MIVEKINYRLSLTSWYYILENEHLLDYNIYSYWNENGGLILISDNLPLDENLRIGEIFNFDFNSIEFFGTERNFVKDFDTNNFQILEIINCFWNIEDDEIVRYKLIELVPLYRNF